MISIIYEQRAIPVYFEFLDKLGSSNLTEQTTFISQILPLFKTDKIILLGDREFCSVKLANWLRQKEILFCLRLKKNEFIELENNVSLQLNDLGLKLGTCLFLEEIKVTKTQNMSGFNLAGKWQRKIKGIAPKEGWFILTNLDKLELAVTSAAWQE